MRERILEISKQEKLSHLGSSLGVFEVLEEVEKVKKPEDYVVLDAAHGALGYYVWLENQGKGDAVDLLHKHGVHQERDLEHEIMVSGGSLGLAASVSLGMAFADRNKDIYVITSDGAFQEGVWAESLRIARRYKLDNWKVYMSFNGFGAYHDISLEQTQKEIDGLGFPVTIVETKYAEQMPTISGLEAHYMTLNEESYKSATNELKEWKDKYKD